MKNKYIVFQCRKCKHLLFVKNISVEKLEEVSKLDCPECGEEGYENWILVRSGNYEKEYGDT